MHNLADTYDRQGKHRDAEVLLKQCLDKEKLVVGENHPTTLMTMICLANNYVHQDRLYDAEAIYKQVLDKQKVVLGENHPSTLKTMYLYSLIEQLNK